MNAQSSFYLYFIRFPSIVAVILLLWVGTFARRGFLDWRRMTLQNRELTTKLAAAKSQKEQLERQVENLTNNPAEQERLIRQILGFVRNDEVVIEFN